jgi:hypothetical protein
MSSTLHARLTELVTAYQQHRGLDADTPAADIAAALTMLGPAYLLGRALTGGAPAAAVENGIHGLLGESPTARRRPAARAAR